MHDITDGRRRSILKMLAGAPLLPVAGLGNAMRLAGGGVDYIQGLPLSP